MAHIINEEECIQCGSCESVCPTGAISYDGEKYIIEQFSCIDCGACAGVCPSNAAYPYM